MFKSVDVTSEHRLLGFAFPVPTANMIAPSEEEMKDKVIRYVGVKRRTPASHAPAGGTTGGSSKKGASATPGVVGHEAGLAASGALPNPASNPPKLKRKRKANQPPPDPVSLPPSSSITGLPKPDPDQPAQLHTQGELPTHMLSRPSA
jgi:hypothetical protein